MAAYAPALFVRSEAEIRRPVVLLSGAATRLLPCAAARLPGAAGAPAVSC